MQPKQLLQRYFDDIEASRHELNQQELDLESLEKQMEELLQQLSTVLNEAETIADIEAIKSFQQAIEMVFQKKYSDLDSQNDN